ncbi:hypothetical protein Sta7437_3218 [Stanieria cyanosphaera PCC 7437]|uniref:Uncharacterized protein n=1 Tax=Stanieria cyanosphaera (strain ATCC 29371 / PCC 7437) TaxID=111780 RepID=K9XVV8_STAC7|nr:hypothetical protein [Stanieria cyanosphaera]AFZ36725.1 hypothetical protein Sta7437_3218 [Stanieria cyanosphaera PCC 7437]
MIKPLKILLQTTILPTKDDWSIARFSLLKDYLASLTDENGNLLCEVTSRDREINAQGNEPILSSLGDSNFDQLWLFALDVGDGLTDTDCQGILAFHQSGRGIFTTRDHQDMGICMCGLDLIGKLHYFQSQQPDPDESRRCRDDIHTTSISWPNYHSGSNGDYQIVNSVEPLHVLLKNPNSPTGKIEFFPAHPHEGAIGVPQGITNARIIATGISKISSRPFNLVVATESTQDDNGNLFGRVVAQSTFHHFVDYNWDISKGCPSFVAESAGDGMKTEPRALEDIKTYVKNLVLWLSARI